MDKIKNVVGFISVALILVIAISSIVIRFIYPQLTETQILFKTWWLYIPLSIGVVGFHWGFNSKQN